MTTLMTQLNTPIGKYKMKTRRGKHAKFTRFYEYMGMRYMCFTNRPDRGSSGFVAKCGTVIWLSEDEVTELPPECDSFDWVLVINQPLLCPFCSSKLIFKSPLGRDEKNPKFQCSSCSTGILVTNPSYLPRPIFKRYWKAVKSKKLTTDQEEF